MASFFAVWAELSQIVDESAALGTYPVERLSEMIQEIGRLANSTAFDALYEKVVDAVRQRRSEGQAGEAYSKRGVQKLEQDKPYEAIQWFGRAEELLVDKTERLVPALGPLPTPFQPFSVPARTVLGGWTADRPQPRVRATPITPRNVSGRRCHRQRG